MSHCCGSIRSSDGSAGQTGAPGSGLPPGVLDEDLLVWDDALQLWVPTQPTILLHYAFGASQIATGTSFLFPWYEVIASAATEAAAGNIRILLDGTLRGLGVVHASPTAADDITYTAVLNTVLSTFDITLNSGASSGSAPLESLAVLAGDILGFRAIGATGARTIRAEVNFYLEAIPP